MIVLFGVFWVIQTVELWPNGGRVRNAAEVAETTAGTQSRLVKFREWTLARWSLSRDWQPHWLAGWPVAGRHWSPAAPMCASSAWQRCVAGGLDRYDTAADFLFSVIRLAAAAPAKA